jgi:GNAT superfamily N-acetyltransferase
MTTNNPTEHPLFADLALARRLEAADAWFKLSYAQAQNRLYSELGTAVLQTAGGCAAYLGPGSPLNRAVGLGMSGPVSADELARIEELFQARGEAARVELCPLADPCLLRLLNQREYRLTEFKNTWVRRLGAGETFPASDVEVKVADPEDSELWIRTVAQGFKGHDALTPGDLVIPTPNYHMPSATCFLAWVDGEAAGGGVMATYEGLAALFSASTRPAFRGRGAQTALLHARLAAAVAAGCDLALVHTTPGTASQRNVERAGFRLAYTKMALVREYLQQNSYKKSP